MARMHSRKRGEATSKRPTVRKQPGWVRYKKREIEMLILKFAKDGNPPSKIGLLLRDTYGIPDVKILIGKSISKLLKENKVETQVPEDVNALIKKAALIQRHLEKNKNDMPALLGIQLTEAKIKRLVKYYKRTGKLAKDWKYDRSKIRMFIE